MFLPAYAYPSDHHPTEAGERKRVLKHGMRLDEEADRIIQGSIGLNLSRSFGDYNFKYLQKNPREQGFLAVPEVHELHLKDYVPSVSSISSVSSQQSSKPDKRKRRLSSTQQPNAAANQVKSGGGNFCVFFSSDGVWNGSFSGQDESQDINELVALHLMKVPNPRMSRIPQFLFSHFILVLA